MSRRNTRVGKYSSFAQVGEQLLDQIIARLSAAYTPDIDGTYKVDGQDFIFSEGDAVDELLAEVAFHKTLYHPYGISGDVRVYKVQTSVLEELKDGWRLLVFIVDVRSGHSAFKEAHDLDGEFLRYFAKKAYTYSANALVVAVIIVKEQILAVTLSEYVDADEREIARCVMVSARLAKSLSRGLVPVLDFVGNRVVDFAVVGYEEIIFVETLRYLLSNLMRRGFRDDTGDGRK